jgi:hypothetical protein
VASVPGSMILYDTRMRRMPARAWHSPTFTTWGSMAVRLASVLLVLPLVLSRYDAADVAVWQLFGVLSTLALLFDFGMAPTFARLLAYARGGASVAQMLAPAADAPKAQAGAIMAVESAAAVLATQRWLYARLAVAATLVMALVGSLALAHPIAQTTDPLSAWAAWALVFVTLGIGLWGSGYGAALQGMDRIAELRRWEIGCGLAQVVCSAGVLMLGGGLLALVASYQFWVVFNALRNRRLMQRQFPALMAVAPRNDRAVLRVMWPAAWRSGVGVLMSLGVVQASGVIYSQIAAPADVAAYLLALRIITAVSQFSQAPFYSKLPQLATLHVAQQLAAQLALAQRGMRMAHWSFVAGTAAVAVAMPTALEAIGSRVTFVTPGVWAVMCLAFFAERFGAMHLQLYSVTNHIVWHIANGVAGVLIVGLALALYPQFGLVALPAGMLLAYGGFYCAYSFAQSSRAFGFTLAGFEPSVSLGPGLVLVGVVTGAALWAR